MKKGQITQNLIESLSESVNDRFSERVQDTVYNVVSCAIEALSQKNGFIVPEKCVLIPVNETATGAFSQLSTFDFFLGIDNPQVGLNTKPRRAINWRYFWSEFRANFRVGRRKDKKKKAENQQAFVANNDVTKYGLSDFRHDLMFGLANFLTPSSVVYEHTNRVTIVGAEDFGTNVKINIYITLFSAESMQFRMFDESNGKFFVVDFGKRFDTLEEKKTACGEKNVTDMLKIFNAIYVRSANKTPNQILVESLVCGAPNQLFVDGDTYRTFVNLANYIRMTQPRSFPSVCDSERSLFDEPLVVKSGAQVQFSKLVRILDEYKF